jgi:hypothetical protein
METHPKWNRTANLAGLAALSLDQGAVVVAAGYFRGILLIEINSGGKVLWARHFYYPNQISFFVRSSGSILQDSEGGFLLAAPSFRLRNTFVYGMNVLRVSPSRKLVWHKFFGISDDRLRVQDVTSPVDGGFVMAGSLINPSVTSNSAFVAKIDPEGTIKWKRQLDIYDRSRFMAVAGFPDGTIGLSGVGSGTASLGALLGRLSANGKVSNSCDVFRGFPLESQNVPTFQANIPVQSHALPKSTKTWPPSCNRF